MDKFAVDYNCLDQDLNKPRCFKLSDIQNKITKVAFDVVRFIDSDKNIDGLWQIQQNEDGEYIVAVYDDAEVIKSSEWKVIRNASGTHVNVFYKNGTPVGKIALAEVGIPMEDAHLVCRYLPEKLANNKKLVEEIMDQLPETEKQAIFNKHPELK